MAKQPTRPTPYFDAWRTSLRRATDGPGLKTDLARHMAAIRGQSLATWQVNIGKILRKESILNAEDLLAIDSWIVKKSLVLSPDGHPAQPRTGQALPRKKT